jgi:hypothetical protein
MDSDPSSFPAGFAGQGLLLLRGVVAGLLLLCIASRANGAGVQGLVIGATALISFGLCTRWAAVAAVAAIVSTNPLQTGPLVIATLALALALTGPGSLSLDAWLFGRRKIRLLPRDQEEM